MTIGESRKHEVTGSNPVSEPKKLKSKPWQIQYAKIARRKKADVTVRHLLLLIRMKL